MKQTITAFMLILGMIIMTNATLSAQDTYCSETPSKRQVKFEQKHQHDILFVTGKVVNRRSGKKISSDQIFLKGISSEIVDIDINENGDYVIALDKSNLLEVNELVVQINGFESFKVKNIQRGDNVIRKNLRLKPIEDKKLEIVYGDDPFGTTVLSFR